MRKLCSFTTLLGDIITIWHIYDVEIFRRDWNEDKTNSKDFVFVSYDIYK